MKKTPSFALNYNSKGKDGEHTLTVNNRDILLTRGGVAKLGRKRRRPDDLPILTRDDLLARVKLLSEMRDQAFISVLYLTGARISEIVGQKKKGKKGFLVRQYRTEEKNGNEYRIFVGILTLKRREVFRRSIPVNVNREREFVFYIDQWMQACPGNLPVFNFSRVFGWQITNKVGVFPHFLRHLRNTHLVQNYGFNSSQLKTFNGWSDEKPASTYVHLGYHDLLKKMEESGR